MTRYTLARVADQADWQAYHDIRRSALWEERGRSGYDDASPDEHRPHHHPLLLKFDRHPTGTTRLDDQRDGTGVVRLVAISAMLRGNGHGRVMNAMVERYAVGLGIRTLFVNAAADAVGFYVATGWSRLEDGRPPCLEGSGRSVPMWKSVAR